MINKCLLSKILVRFGVKDLTTVVPFDREMEAQNGRDHTLGKGGIRNWTHSRNLEERFPNRDDVTTFRDSLAIPTQGVGVLLHLMGGN